MVPLLETVKLRLGQVNFTGQWEEEELGLQDLTPGLTTQAIQLHTVQRPLEPIPKSCLHTCTPLEGSLEIAPVLLDCPSIEHWSVWEDSGVHLILHPSPTMSDTSQAGYTWLGPTDMPIQVAFGRSLRFCLWSALFSVVQIWRATPGCLDSLQGLTLFLEGCMQSR